MEQSQGTVSHAGLPGRQWQGLTARWVWLTVLASLAVALLFSGLQLLLQGTQAPLGEAVGGTSWAGVLLANGLKALCSAGVVLFILLILTYTVIVYRVFRGKVRHGEGYHH